MRIAIIDDDADERKTLQASFERLAQESGSAIVIIEFAGADDFLDGYDRSFDLICMDIDMSGTDGMSAAQRLRQMDADVPLVFVTNMAQMAIHGYAVHALDFILKPINYYSFSIKMRGILALIGNRRRKSLVFPTTDGFLRISSDNLYYVEVRGHHLSFHTTQGVIRQRDSLRNWEAKLEGLPFERCNNSYLVNLKQVTAVAKDSVQVGCDWLPISRTKKKPFMNALTEYMGGTSV